MTREQAGHVLVVDDNELNRDRLTLELEDAGFMVSAASSGPQGIEIARSIQPEMILLDVAMPEMDGIETCHRLKSDSETSHIPVVFLTASSAAEETTVHALDAGANDFLTRPYTPAILFARVRTQIQISRANERLRTLAMTDELTGAYSRRFLFQALRRAIKTGVRSGWNAVSVLVIDLDHFKQLNDTDGHSAGDRTLIEFTRICDDVVREIDVVARLGGDEFVVMLPDTELEGAKSVANRLRAAVEAKCDVTTSIGAATLSLAGAQEILASEALDQVVSHVLNAADHALYDAKHDGRNRVASAEPLSLGPR